MMNGSSPKKVDQVQQAAQHKVHKPRWLEAFLRKTFFGSCEAHPIRRNELNKYCINCDMSACQYCLSSGAHRHHKILKIYRHVYKDVVSLGTMEKFMDCSQIQPYKCNKRWVMSLNPLPHSGSTTNSETACEICKRRLTEPDSFRYCSISCKFTAVSRKPCDSVPPFISIQSPTQEIPKKAPEHQKPVKKRKGTPCRAPFF